MEKYIVYLDRYAVNNEVPVIALKYDSRRKKLYIGGYSRFRRSMISLIENFFQLTLLNTNVREVYPQKNKVRFNIVLSSRKVYAGIDAMEKSGIQMKPVTNLERIMR